MRKLNFAIFFTVALSVYALINFYIVLRAWQLLSLHHVLREFCLVIIVVLAAAFVAGRILERVRLTWLSTALVWSGSFWLAAMAYFFMLGMAIDILRLSNYVFPWFPSFLDLHSARTKDVVAIVVTAIVVIAVFLGHLNAIRPRIKTLNLSVGKKSSNVDSFNIVAVSDIHLGTIIGKSRLQRIVALINSLDADLVLLPGDVFDEDIGPVIKENLGETLRTIRSKHGVVAITGNHEYIGGAEAACRYLNDHGIAVLRDGSLTIDGVCTVVGREDLSSRQFGGKQRKNLDDLMNTTDGKLPVILLDHQPFHLEDAEKHGVDLQLSGHTHHGQLWPFNYISQKIFEVSWGYKKKGNTHIYVSCGVGTWGPPVRIGNTPEIVNIRLAFD
jgi:predicted MPP superfamily phosphohydrolase